jgi:ribosomal protein RSM22 (predicted rRNA methylase)
VQRRRDDGRRSAPSRIHQGLVGPRELVGRPYLADAGLRREYDAEIAPRTRAAFAKLLRELPPGFSPRRALDLGAGTGAAGAALRAHFGEALELVSVDRVAAPGVVVADLRRPGRPPGVEGRFDLVVSAHLLNELARDLDVGARAALVLGWAEALLAPGGLLLLVEPALRETSRDLLAMRDLLVARGLGVLAPCLHAGPCPALARERDWCHDSAPWAEEGAGGRAAGAARGGRSRVDFSYLLLQPGATPAADARLYRIVSDPLREKGRTRLFGCGPSGRTALVRLDRDEAPANAALVEAARGDLLRVEGGRETGEGVRLGPEARVERVTRGGRGEPG